LLVKEHLSNVSIKVYLKVFQVKFFRLSRWFFTLLKVDDIILKFLKYQFLSAFLYPDTLSVTIKECTKFIDYYRVFFLIHLLF